MNKINNLGFTLIEIIIVIAVISILSMIAIPNFISIKKSLDLNNNVQEFVSVLRLAQNKALLSENYSQFGVYVSTEGLSNQYTLFKGASYALREVSADRTYFLQSPFEFYEAEFSGGNEIIFDRLTGNTENLGSVTVRIIGGQEGMAKTIYVDGSGAVGFSPFVASSDEDRVVDSRHVHFDYSRNIDTNSENIILTLDNSVTKSIEISSYLIGGEFKWQGVVSVEGADQKLEIITHRLNNPDTLFSIHRDRRYNNKSLKITISGDSSGYLAQYSGDGLNTDFSSMYVSNFEWQ